MVAWQEHNVGTVIPRFEQRSLNVVFNARIYLMYTNPHMKVLLNKVRESTVQVLDVSVLADVADVYVTIVWDQCY